MINRTRRLAIVIVALAASACAVTTAGDPTTAAVVGDRSITTAEIDENLASIRTSESFRQQAEGDTSGAFVLDAQTQLATAFVRSEILALVAEREGVTVSDDDVAQARDALVEQLGGAEAFRTRLAEQGLAETFLLQQLRDQQTQEALQAQIGEGAQLADFIRTQLEDVDIEVNPRYGQWDPASLSVASFDPLAPDGGVTPTDGASPAAGTP